MIPNPTFRNQPKLFWAYVRTISQHLGYTVRHADRIRVPSSEQVLRAMSELGLNASKIIEGESRPTILGQLLLEYFEHRSNVLYNTARPNLMKAAEAKQLFEQMQQNCNFECPIPMNKQKGKMAKPAYFTGIINMLIAAGLGGAQCDYAPLELTTVTKDGSPLRTLARRVDGAFPTAVNPIAIWEIKEYYYTTTFGSRIADGVYETLLDGMELEELREHEGIDVKHYLMVDAYETWWQMGKSYLCRMVDLLHMGYVDELLLGREVVDRIPALTEEWLTILKNRQSR